MNIHRYILLLFSFCLINAACTASFNSLLIAQKYDQLLLALNAKSSTPTTREREEATKLLMPLIEQRSNQLYQEQSLLSKAIAHVYAPSLTFVVVDVLMFLFSKTETGENFYQVKGFGELDGDNVAKRVAMVSFFTALMYIAPRYFKWCADDKVAQDPQLKAMKKVLKIINTLKNG